MYRGGRSTAEAEERMEGQVGTPRTGCLSVMEALQRGHGAVVYGEHRMKRSRRLDEDECCIY